MTPSKPCVHRDVHDFGNMQCCLSCGEPIYKPRVLQKTIFRNSAPDRSPEQAFEYVYSEFKSYTGLETRVVILLPGNNADPLCCFIINVNLLEQPTYEAVSYTWATDDGDDRKLARMYCDGAVIAITENCEAVLRGLRSKLERRTLWIDAVCIDQSNTKERNHQVGFMDEIYRNALRVQIYIHDPERDYSEGLRWLEEGSNHSEATFTQITELFRRRYFQRVWVIQEVLLAKEAVLSINKASIRLSRMASERIEQTYAHKGVKVPAVLGPSRKWKLLSCIRAFSDCRSSDPRDQVYAILSLLDPPTRQLIPVDYSLDIPGVFRNVVMASIMESQSLYILAFARMPTGNENDWQTANTFGQNEWIEFLRMSGKRHDKCSREKQHESGEDHESSPYWLGHISVQSQASSDVKPSSTVTNEMLIDKFGFSSHFHSTAKTLLIASDAGPCGQYLPRLRVHAHFIDVLQKSNMENDSIIAREQKSALQFAKTIGARKIFFVPPQYEWSLRQYLDQISTSQRQPPLQRWGRIKWTDFNSFARKRSERLVNGQLEEFNIDDNIGYTTSYLSGDYVAYVDGLVGPLLLRKVDSQTYRVISKCVIWPTRGFWPNRAMSHMRHHAFKETKCSETCFFAGGCEEARVIEIY